MSLRYGEDRSSQRHTLTSYEEIAQQLSTSVQKVRTFLKRYKEEHNFVEVKIQTSFPIILEQFQDKVDSLVKDSGKLYEACTDDQEKEWVTKDFQLSVINAVLCTKANRKNHSLKPANQSAIGEESKAGPNKLLGDLMN